MLSNDYGTESSKQIAMGKGKVLGACLDVLEYEKASFENLTADGLPKEMQYLIDSEKTILSPHIAGWTHESNIRLAKILYKKINILFKNP
jgi:D-3-phosphoglycerate dehydrogenase